MNRDHLSAAVLLAAGFAAYKLCILLAWNGDALAEHPWVDLQPTCFVALFLAWGVSTAVALLVALRLVARREEGARLQLVRSLVGPSFAIALGSILLFLALLFEGSSLAALIACACAFSASCAVLHFGWLAAVARTPTLPLVGVLTVGQMAASVTFLTLKQAGTEVQAGFLVAACAVLFATTLALVTRLEVEGASLSSFAPPHGARSGGEPLLAGIAVSALGVCILWGSSSSIRDYTLWVFGAIAVCLAFFAVAFVRKKEARPETLVRVVFAVLGVAILLTAVAPDWHAVFMGVVWVGYSLLALCLFLLGRDSADNATGADGRLLTRALALFSGSIAVGLTVGRLMDVVAPAIETPTAVAVALLLAFIILFGDRAFGRTNADRPDEGRREAEAVNDALRDACLTFAASCNLTEAEQDTLFYLAKGFTINRIAEERVVSKNTVKSQITSIYRKAGVHSKQGLLDLLNDQ